MAWRARATLICGLDLAPRRRFGRFQHIPKIGFAEPAANGVGDLRDLVRVAWSHRIHLDDVDAGLTAGGEGAAGLHAEHALEEALAQGLVFGGLDALHAQLPDHLGADRCGDPVDRPRRT